jgi:O-antigen ligase
MFDGYRDRILAPDRAALLSRFRPESPHNVYVATAAGAGVPALVAYLAVIGLSGAGMVVAMRSGATPGARIFAAACLAAAAGHLVTDTFVTAETTSSVLFWTVLGAGLAAGRRWSPN